MFEFLRGHKEALSSFIFFSEKKAFFRSPILCDVIVARPGGGSSWMRSEEEGRVFPRIYEFCLL